MYYQRFHGIPIDFYVPKDITTDNGPPWDSYEIKKFFEDRIIKHILNN